jgi:hypothetical protein
MFKNKKIFICIIIIFILLIFYFYNNNINELKILPVQEEVLNQVKIEEQKILAIDKEALKLINEQFAREYWKEDTLSVQQCPFSQLSARGFTREESLNIIKSYDADELENIEEFLKKYNIIKK